MKRRIKLFFFFSGLSFSYFVLRQYHTARIIQTAGDDILLGRATAQPELDYSPASIIVHQTAGALKIAIQLMVPFLVFKILINSI